MLDWLITNAAIVSNESNKNNNIVSLELNTEKINSVYDKIKIMAFSDVNDLSNRKRTFLFFFRLQVFIS